MISLRRTLQQAKHCVTEALSVLDNNEEVAHADGDVYQAIELLTDASKQLRQCVKMQERPL